MKFWSEEWYNAVKDKTNTDAAYLKDTKGLTLNMLYVVTEMPGGIDKRVECEMKDGKIASFKMEEKPAPSDYRTETVPPKIMFRAMADYETYRKLAQGEISTAVAATSGAYKIDGDFMGLMAKMGPLTAYNILMGTVPFEL